MKNMSLLPYSVIFFDLDGTLIDSERIYHRFWIEAAEKSGYPMDDAIANRLRSLDHGLAKKYLNSLYHDENAFARIRTERIRMMDAYLDGRSIPEKPGASALLSALETAGKPYYIVTASAVDTAIKNAGRAGITLNPSHIISTKGLGIACGKPAPDVYLRACSVAGIAPGDALAVEDASNGVKSAHDAGCRTIMIPDLTQPTEEEREMVVAVFPSLRELQTALGL